MSVLRAVERSVWLVRAGSARFYCSLRFRYEDEFGWRYDNNCMAPANDAASEVAKAFRLLIHGARGDAVDWSPGQTVILSNWKVLHGRGPAPKDERERILERIYLE